MYKRPKNIDEDINWKIIDKYEVSVILFWILSLFISSLSNYKNISKLKNIYLPVILGLNNNEFLKILLDSIFF